jgi:glutamyl-tRNA reductase
MEGIFLKLLMTGLDHTRADLSVRERFAIPKEKTQEILLSFVSSGIISGCVIISTCNRTEMYASVPLDKEVVLSRLLCDALDKDYSEYEYYFTEKTEESALEHLCRVASGLDSQIIGDDQIITQAREALELSREQNCTDSYIEKMFNRAIQAAKTIKTKVILRTLGVDSVPGAAVETLKNICELKGQTALIIGNGQMGRLVASLLIAEGVMVTITLRQYKKGEIVVPEGAGTIGYSDRYQAIQEADLLVSATSSPHHTVYRNDLEKLAKLPKIIVDLAVPRDIEPTIEEMPGITVLTVDDISRESRALPDESIVLIDSIIKDNINKYYDWYRYKNASVKA